MHFSNSLIIHEEKTKEITTVKEVWICDPNYHKIRRRFALIFSKNYQCFEKLYQTLERVFHQISKHFEVGSKNSAAPRFFNPLLSVWISDETLFLVFDILLNIRKKSFPGSNVSASDSRTLSIVVFFAGLQPSDRYQKGSYVC